MLTTNLKKAAAFTLVELVIAIVLTSIAIMLFFGVYTSTQSKSVSPVIQIKAAELGQAYLEEISLKRFDELSPVGNVARCDQAGQPVCSGTLGIDGTETRTTFDDVDDYNNLSESPPLDALGNSRTGFNGFTANITVNYAGSDQGFNQRALKRIEVIITSPENDLFTFSLYKGNF